MIHLFQHKVVSITLKSQWLHTSYTVHCLFLPVGLKESAGITHADSLLLAEVEDEIRRQVGVVYSQDLK